MNVRWRCDIVLMRQQLSRPRSRALAEPLHVLADEGDAAGEGQREKGESDQFAHGEPPKIRSAKTTGKIKHRTITANISGEAAGGTSESASQNSFLIPTSLKVAEP